MFQFMGVSQSIEPIIIIHGTGAKDSKWYRQGSRFCLKLDEFLSEIGCNARCWSYLDEDDREFTWRGGNSEADRDLAHYDLTELIKYLENKKEVKRYHIIAHSHGGNVLLRSLYKNAHSSSKLKTLVFMGVPFLENKRNALISIILNTVYLAPFLLLLYPFYYFFNNVFFEYIDIPIFENTIGNIYFLTFLAIAISTLSAFIASIYSNSKINHHNFNSYYILSKYDEAFFLLNSIVALEKNLWSNTKLITGNYRLSTMPGVAPDTTVFKKLGEGIGVANNNFSGDLFLFRGTYKNLFKIYSILHIPITFTIYMFKRLSVWSGLRSLISLAKGDDLSASRIISYLPRSHKIDLSRIEITSNIEDEFKERALKYNSNIAQSFYNSMGEKPQQYSLTRAHRASTKSIE